MTSLKSDSLGDFVVESNDLALINDVEEKTQILKENLRTFFGEWFLDTSYGVPYFQVILKKNIDPVQINSVIKNIILLSSGVSELVSYESTFSTDRKLSVTFSVRFNDKIVNFNEVLI